MINYILSRSFLVASVCVVLLAGCGPRGESHTVDQILSDARSSYMDLSSSAGGDVAATLKSLSASLDKLAGIGGGGDARQVSGGVVDVLTELLPKTGFTQRAAISELINQYRTISTSSGAPLTLGAANLKVVVARTYTILSSELTSTKFRIS